MTLYRLLLLTTCLGFVAAVLVGERQKVAENASAPSLEFQMRTATPGYGKMYVDYGAGHNEMDCTTFPVQGGEAFHHYSIRFPREAGTVRNIRLDPIHHSAELVIRNPRLLEQNAPPRSVPLSRFKAIEDRAPLSIVGTSLHLTVTVPQERHYPILLIEEMLGTSDVLSRAGSREPTIAGSKLWQFGFLAVAILCVWLILFPGVMQWLATSAARSFAYSSTARIVGCAVAGAIVSSYAVIFFGMSLVSPPLIGSLYSRAPWVAGFEHSGEIESLTGSDIGASYWTTLPNTAAQYEALFVFSEFPFWNRYTGGGIPLYAQGQSMIGDPLHLLAVVSQGASWGWDAKTILEKCVFASGIGILVRNLTGSVTSGMLLAIAANFLAFHIWRLNHPALFVITYCPWLLLMWINLGNRLAENQAGWRKKASAALAVAALAFIQLNSGATKEAVITAGYTNALGIGLFALRLSERHSRAFVCVAVSLATFALACCTAPYWLLFIDALSKSFTMYNPMASTLRGQSPLLYFEPFFLMPVGSLMAFVNLPVMLGAVIALVSLPWHRPMAKVAVVFTAGASLGVAFGVIPESLLVGIPLIQGIQHIGNTFSVAAITPFLLLAGYGVADFLSEAGQRRRWLLLAAGVVIGVLLLHWAGAYALSEPRKLDAQGSSEATAALMVLASVTAALAGLWAALLVGVSRSRESWPWWIAAICAVPLLLRCAVHPMTGVARLDTGRRIVNAYPRVDYAVPSEAVEFVKNEQVLTDLPTRVIGEGTVLFPGFNIRYLLEGVVPVEPLRSGFMDRLLEVLDYPDEGWGWLKLIASSQLDSRAQILDMLNVGYVLAMPEVQMPQSLQLVHSADLKVWKRPSAWPRAFFTTTIRPVASDSEFATLAKTTPPPFALVSIDDLSRMPVTTPGRSRSGREFRLTTNSTSFTVDADGPGMIVIHENYYPGDFVARLNGRVVDYIKVNGAFKGVPVSGPGTYRVSFEYRPEKLGLSLMLMALGVGLCVAGPALATPYRSTWQHVSHRHDRGPLL